MNLYPLLVSLLSASSHADPDPDTHLHVHLHPEEGGGAGGCCVERHPWASLTSSQEKLLRLEQEYWTQERTIIIQGN